MEEKKETTAVIPAEHQLPATQETTAAPFFVEAEKLFDKFAEITRETALKAFDFFQERGGQLGRDIDDWLHAESKVLRFLPVEIADVKDKLNVTADVAGFKPDEIEISVDGRTLMISGETKREEEKTEKNVVYSDFRSDRFFRQMTLPTPVDADNARAEVKDGILTISFPKVEEAKPKEIAVSAG